jgi:gamma-glutamyl phosphate reductase
MEIIQEALSSIENFPKNVLTQVFTREDVAEMLKQDEYINLII